MIQLTANQLLYVIVWAVSICAISTIYYLICIGKFIIKYFRKNKKGIDVKKEKKKEENQEITPKQFLKPNEPEKKLELYYDEQEKIIPLFPEQEKEEPWNEQEKIEPNKEYNKFLELVGGIK